ncbi:unnamed protein product [Calicophoron daubneyi]|uniref:Heat shock protein 70 n=1 Tax=Calicophoron daubneyi TaxID=300641 RepID=A0AAV2TGH4_CALDB
MPLAIGIDLGTTNCCVAICRDGRVDVLANAEGQLTTPSYITFTENCSIIGSQAKDQLLINPSNTVYDFKRLIGRRMDDPTLQEDIKHWPFSVTQEANRIKTKVQYRKETKMFLPEQLSSMLLGEMRKIAEKNLGEVVTDAVITVPAYFNSTQREATKNAGLIAGLNVLQLLDEPTAAAIAYGFDKDSTVEQNLLVFDFGGGTLDVSVLNVAGKKFTVRATAGDNHLGGEDIDQNLVNKFIDEINDQFHIDVSNDQSVIYNLHNQCEQAKKRLSSAREVKIDLECLKVGHPCQRTLTREEFDQLNECLFQKALKKVDQALADAKLGKSEINQVILAGGSSRIPKMQELLSAYFSEQPLNKSVNPDEVVASGAAIFAASLSAEKNEGVLDMEVVNVIPYSLGWEIHSGQMVIAIGRNTPFPTEHTLCTTTVCDNQKEIKYKIYEGEHAVAKDNRFLDEFTIPIINTGERGVPKVRLTFSVDKNGILTVTAREKDTTNERHLRITRIYESLSEEEIQEIARQTESFRLENEKHYERLSIWNEVETEIYSIKKQAKAELDAHRLSPSRYKQIVDTCDGTSKWLESNRMASKEEFEKKRDEVNALQSSFGVAKR